MREAFRWNQAAALAVLALGLAACDPSVPRPPATQAPAPANSIFVSRGETLYDVARRYNVPTRDLIEANGLKPPYVLTAGQRLVLPVPRQYVVKAGDTLYGVSRQFNLDMKEIVTLNGIAPPYMIRVGQTLRLPAVTGRQGGTPATQVAVAAPPAVGVAVAPERKPAPLPPAAGAAARRTPAVEAVPLDAPPAAPPPAAAPARPAAAPEPALPPAVPRIAAVPPAAAPTAAASGLLWPVTGTVLSEFGSKANGMHNDGINIAAPRGTPVRAAGDGVVAYVGNELKGFGNLVLVRHGDGMMTAYGHLERMDVQKGAPVKRGQTIGAVGATGNVSTPQLHFEVRKGSRAIDPRDQLTGSSAPRAAG